VENIKNHLNAAYEHLTGVIVGGEAKMPIGLAMAHLVEAMQEILAYEKREEEKSQGETT